MNLSTSRVSESKDHGDERSQHLLTEFLQIFREIIIVVIVLDRTLILIGATTTVRCVCLLIVDGVVIVPMFLSKILIGQLTHRPHIEAELWIGDVGVRNVTIASISLNEEQKNSDEE